MTALKAMPALLALVALAWPMAPVQARMIAVPMCGGGVTMVNMDGDAPAEDPAHGCCAKLCHAGDTRRKRLADGGCCP